MKTIQTIIIAMTAILLLTLAGCQEPKGYLERKEPKPELKGDAIRWTVNGPVDASGNPIELEEVK
ncbi:hypothetical protein [Nitrosomonas ureae]|uniref:Uncharacterized protein n=1 Tax=Nitrosomonas ureae TaxID=44577 RepID=A0A286ALB6_9PROT|nr:hypothetical protein [Nitrosomonas ureae]SOD22665.1 hypothetical protein SAMN06297164_3546 [Nitrosomonas ureae]